jgi:uncharacterized membrane protein YqjE
LNRPAGLFASLRGFATTGVALLRTRVELLRVEAQEEVGRIGGLLLWGIIAVLCGIVGLTFLAVLVTVLLWETQRVLALAVFTTLFLGGAVVAAVIALRLARRGSQLFSASLAELRRDETALRGNEPQ